MIEQWLQKNYNIHPYHLEEREGITYIMTNNERFAIAPADNLTNEELAEIYLMATYLHENGVNVQTCPIPNVNQQFITALQDRAMVIYVYRMQQHKKMSFAGKELAYFHQLGMMFPYQLEARNRYGNWNEYWEKRLDQLEQYMLQLMRKQHKSEMEMLLLETFPYFLGITENAIQYIAEHALESQGTVAEIGTICHLDIRKALRQDRWVANEWIYDHPSRDLAEWIRYCTLSNRTEHIFSFLFDYESIQPIDGLWWKNIIGRLLFPLPYFQLVEHYFSAADAAARNSTKHSLLQLLATTDHMERLIKELNRYIRSRYHVNIPRISWIEQK